MRLSTFYRLNLLIQEVLLIFLGACIQSLPDSMSGATRETGNVQERLSSTELAAMVFRKKNVYFPILKKKHHSYKLNPMGITTVRISVFKGRPFYGFTFHYDFRRSAVCGLSQNRVVKQTKLCYTLIEHSELKKGLTYDGKSCHA